MASSGARVPRRLGVAHVGKDDLKVVLILLDGWKGARGSDDVKRVLYS